MKLLSDACEYGLRAVVWLSQCPDEPQKVKDIAEQIKAPAGYLIKVLQDLTKAGILSARRGSNGGFLMLSDPAKITPLDVINAIDPIERINTCPLGIAIHGSDLCQIHRRIDDAMGAIEESFQRLSIHEVIAKTVENNSFCNVLMSCGEMRDSCVQNEATQIREH